MRYPSHSFQLEFKDVCLRPEIRAEFFQEYFALKKKDKKTEQEKLDLKELRAILRQPFYVVEASLKRHYTKDRVPFAIQGEYESAPTLKDIKELLQKLINKYHEYKISLRKEAPADVQEFYGVELKKVGKVYTKPGSIFFADKNNHKNSPNINKKPRLNVNYIGVELEFNDGDDFDEEQSVISNYLKQQKLGKYCNLVSDGSCGHELRVLLEEKEYEQPLKAIMNGLKDLDFDCNDKCGTHVHLDMRHRDVKQVYSNLVAVQDIMYKLVPPDRRKNTYCQKNPYKSYDEAKKKLDETRYLYVNHHAYDKHKTLEVRLHHGTLDFDELNQWLKLLLKIVNYDGAINASINKMAELARVLKFDKDEITALRKRYRKHNRKTKPPKAG